MEENISIVENISLAKKIFLFCVDIYTLWRMSLHFGEYHYIVENITTLWRISQHLKEYLAILQGIPPL